MRLELESTDFNMFYAMFWYLIGIFSYKIISKVLQFATAAAAYRETLISALALLGQASDNFESSNEFSYKNGKEYDEARARQDYENNKKALEFWRRMAILNLINLTPAKLSALIEFKDWRGAMRYLREKGTENVNF